MSVLLAASAHFLSQGFGPPVKASNNPAAPEDDGSETDQARGEQATKRGSRERKERH
jgi:hypothetical protein